MTKIEVLCPACSTKTVLTPDVVALWEDACGTRTYAFVCLVCVDVTIRHTDARGAAMLTAAGVEWWQPPARPEHPESPPGGAPFTPDDLLVFHELLAGDQWSYALAAGCRQERGGPQRRG